jgi:ADP-ribosyl-[dinitrogen reductase] hydrolase
MNTPTFRSRVQGCFLGVAIGDAMGMPVETMKREQILEATNGTGVTGFVDPIIRKDWLKDLKAGDTTDDWQLTRAVARSLIRTKGIFDPHDCAVEHIMELERSKFGWGSTTQTGIEMIMREERKATDPRPSMGQGKGCGNGIIMKVAPLSVAAIMNRTLFPKFWKDVKALGTITHPDVQASITAVAVGELIKFALFDPPANTNVVEDTLLFLGDTIEEIELEEGFPDTPVYKSMRLAEKTAKVSAEALQKAVGSGFHSIQTAAFCIGTFLRHPTDFRAGVLEAVNAGGDTDTNASVVGALIGANVGIEGIPEEWRAFSPNFQEPVDLADQICSLA